MPRYDREHAKLTKELQDLVVKKLRDLQANPMPAGLRFEKLKGRKDPSVYTVHVTGNYKISMECIGTIAILRRVAPHDEIDRAP